MTITVLAVDDSPTMRKLITRALSEFNFTVHVAEDGVHGLEVLKTCSPDVIITDINMPRLDGFGFVEAVRGGNHGSHLPILALTTESAPELKQRARDAGATGWIIKPFDKEKLVAVIRRVVS